MFDLSVFICVHLWLIIEVKSKASAAENKKRAENNSRPSVWLAMTEKSLFISYA